MYLYETHMHTYPSSACAAVTPEQQVKFYKSKGYAGIIITDHFLNGNTGCPHGLSWEKKINFFYDGYRRAKKAGEKNELDVFFGMEYGISGLDFLVYGISLEFLLENPGFDKLGLKNFSAKVRDAGGYIAQAHPFRQGFWIPSPGAVSPEFIDGIEVYNASMPESVNRPALAYAKRHNLAKQAGSDSHDTYALKPSGISLQKRAESIFDIISVLKAGQANLLCPFGTN
ncbi:MAG: PHP domain-containing protein [Defluviitaleaceae bacterium]|nr:PHP domain-containing protein [Defluviitaleaceae bacterium]